MTNGGRPVHEPPVGKWKTTAQGSRGRQTGTLPGSPVPNLGADE